MSNSQSILIAASILLSGSLIAVTIGMTASGGTADSWVPGVIGVLVGVFLGARAIRELK